MRIDLPGPQEYNKSRQYTAKPPNMPQRWNMRKERQKQPARIRTAIIILIALILLLAAALAAAGLGLMNRIGRPAEVEFAEREDDILITPSPSPRLTPSPTPEPAATPQPTPTPTPAPLPMEELYPQTRLSQAELDKMAAEAEDTRYINVLLLGVDRRGSKGNSNTDTMMIATIDTVNNRLKLTSLLRDMLVNIPGHGYGKLNSAAVRGGMELLLETINTNLHLNITEYVLVDFAMFEKIVDELGGVTVWMSAEEISAANDCIAGLNRQRGVEYLWDGFIFANEGNVKLTGKQALGYARIRKIDSDFSRTNRQFKLLNHIFAKFRKADIAKIYDMMEELLPMVETNMSNQRIATCAMKALSLDVSGLLHHRLPVEELYDNARVEGKSVLLQDMPANAAALHEFIFRSADEAEEARVLSPGESLPPRTPSIYQGADGLYYYYANNMPVYEMNPLPEPYVTPYTEGYIELPQ